MKNNIELNSLALQTRKEWEEDVYSPIDIFSIINQERHLTIVFYPMTERLSGMCIKEKNSVVVGINSNTSYGRQRFTLAHEMYHILYETGLKQIVCEMSMSLTKRDSEREADAFASYLLMPYDGLINYAKANHIKTWTLESVIEAEQFFQISHRAMLLRLKEMGYITSKKYEEYGQVKVTQKAKSMGYSGDLYKSSSEDKKYFSIGEYVRLVEEAGAKEKISAGKREELLMDAFRADIVYGLAEEGMDLND